jgi:hypothetical protein
MGAEKAGICKPTSAVRIPLSGHIGTRSRVFDVVAVSS